MNVPGRRRDDVKVVEQPLGCRRDTVAARVFSERQVDGSKLTGVVIETAQVRAAAGALPARQRQQGSQAAGMIFEQLDAQQLEPAACQ